MLPIILSVFCYDVWFYLSHLFLHWRPVYPIHSVHHAKREPRLLDTYEGHWLESPLQGLGTLAPAVFLTYSWFDIGVILLILNVRGMMRHDDRFTWLIGNHHLLHHKYPQYNYGEYWLDWLGGTLYPLREEAKQGWLYI
jgi:sterol desaturase/sphingolipid hydroxylase (fatty acid hydroxylase superfamily)